MLYPFVLYCEPSPAPDIVLHEQVHLDQIKRDGILRLDLLSGTSLQEMRCVADDKIMRSHYEVLVSVLTVGVKERKINTIQFKDIVRKELLPFAYANVTTKRYLKEFLQQCLKKK